MFDRILVAPLIIFTITLISGIALADPIVPGTYFPPFGSYGSPVDAILLIVLANFLPNLFWLSLLFYLTEIGLRERTPNTPLSGRTALLSLFASALVITLLGALIDFLFVYEKHYYFYEISGSIVKWILAVLLIAITVFLSCKYLLDMKPKGCVIVSAGFALMNPLFWFVSTIGLFAFESPTSYVSNSYSVAAFVSVFLMPTFIVIYSILALLTYGILRRIVLRIEKIGSEEDEDADKTVEAQEPPVSRIVIEDKIMIRRIMTAMILAIAVVSTSVVGLLAIEPADKYPDNSNPLGETLAIALSNLIDFANPYASVTDEGRLFQSLIYDTLTTYDEDLDIVPNLAKSWWYMDGETASTLSIPTDFSAFDRNWNATDWPLGSIWEYNLTENAYWNDGFPFTADDVVFTISIQIRDNFMTYWAYQPYTRWIDRIEKVDDFKVRIFFCDYDSKRPVPVAFGDMLPMPIMAEHIFKGKPSSYIAQDWEGFPIIGTGPFSGSNLDVEDFVGGDQNIALVRNPYYNFTDDEGDLKGLGAEYGRIVGVERVVLRSFRDEASLIILSVRTGLCQLGEIGIDDYRNLTLDPILPAQASLQSVLDARSRSIQTVFYLYDYPGWNPLRKDPAVQRATALATNKTYIKEMILRNESEIGYGLISPANEKWYWEPDDEPSTFCVYSGNGSVIYSYTKPLNRVMEYDIAEANRILDAAGYVWANESGMIVRKAGPIAAERLFAMGIVSAPSFALDKKLIFSQAVNADDYAARSIGEFLLKEWEKIGIWIGTEDSHSLHLIEGNIMIPQWTTWPTEFDTAQISISGDLDPARLTYLPSSFALHGWNQYGTRNATYDSFYSKVVQSLDYSERKKWVDECSKWLYLSGSVIVTTYPRSCFIMNNQTFEFGNWSEKPGLVITNGWAEPPLLTSALYDIKFAEPWTLTEASIIMIAYGLLVDSLLVVGSFKMIARKPWKRTGEKIN
ncbi:MAG: ABC transporter substrate-binding protein [Thermoplasmata archaeon]